MSSANAENAPARVPVLQSVIITRGHRAAIINGQRVELGGQFADARVVRITETEVVLRSPAGAEVLKMYPNVDKAVRPAEAVPRAPKSAGARRTKG
jgi:MSHA biogenesis protein MshK